MSSAELMAMALREVRPLGPAHTVVRYAADAWGVVETRQGGSIRGGALWDVVRVVAHVRAHGALPE